MYYLLFMESNDKYAKFLNWLKINGSILDSTEFPVEFSNVIGVSSKFDIGPNEAIFYIPKKIIIDSNYVKLFELNEFYLRNKKLVNKKYDKNNLINLTIFLILESFKGEKSFWDAYINLICDSSIPIMWKSSELIEIQDENLIESILSDKTQMEHVFNDIKECFKNEMNQNFLKEGTSILNIDNYNFFTFNYFMKFYTFCLTRNFHITENQSFLVPFADNLNHGEVDVNYEIFDSENFITKVTLQEDQDTLNSYLSLTDQTLFHKNRIDKNHLFISRLEDRKKFKIAQLEKMNKNNKNSLIEYKDDEEEESEELEQSVDDDGDENDCEEETTYEKIVLHRHSKRREKTSTESNGFDIGDHYDETNQKLKIFDYLTNNLQMNDTDYFVISTGCSQIYKRGQEIFNCYGKFSNGYLLTWYGFCYTNNSYDKLKIRVKFPNTEDGYLFFKYLQYIFPKLFNEEDEFVVLSFSLKSNFLNLDLIKYATFYYFYENEMSEQFFSYTYETNFEIKIIQNILNLLELTKKKKEEITTLEEDLKIYEDLIKMKSDNLKLKFSLIFRINQKKIINKQIYIYSLILNILFNKEKQSNIEYNIEKNCKRMIDQYFKYKKQEVFIGK